jgi:glycosyltransferase involved in cell wall biosynthesis
MNVVHALGWYFPESLGGTEIYVAALAERLVASGHETSVIAPVTGAGEVSHYIHGGIQVWRYPMPEVLSRGEAQQRVPVPAAARFFGEIIGQLKPDIVHFHTFRTGLGIHELRAAKRTGASVVATNHLASLGFICQRGTLMQLGDRQCDGICELFKCSSCELQHKGLPRGLAEIVAIAGFSFRGLAGLMPEGRIATSLLMTDLISYNQKLQAELMSLLDRFVLLNRRAMEMVIANGGETRKLVLNYLGSSHRGVVPKAGPLKAPTRRPVRFGYLGRLVEIKGILDLARAVREIPRDVSFTLELRGPESDEHSRTTASSFRSIVGDDPRVSIKPAVGTEDVPAALSELDLLCVPSVWFENGPTVVSEAHAVGTPVIGTTVGAMPELIRSGIDGLLLEPGDWRALARAIVQVAENPAGTVDTWRTHLPPARTMDDIADDYLTMYADVLAEQTSPAATSGGRSAVL